MKKKFAIVLLLLVIPAPLLLTFGWLEYQKVLLKQDIKRCMIEGMSRDELVIFKFTLHEAETELEWEHRMEFEFKGQMYDVVNSQSTVDSVFYWCWPDSEETHLNRQLDELLWLALGQNTERKEKQTWILTYFKALYYLDTYTWQPAAMALIIRPFIAYRNHYFFFSFPPPSPPPW